MYVRYRTFEVKQMFLSVNIPMKSAMIIWTPRRWVIVRYRLE